MDKIILLQKRINYEDGEEDMLGCPYYYIKTEVYYEEDVKYFEKRGWYRVEEPETFWGMIKRWIK